MYNIVARLGLVAMLLAAGCGSSKPVRDAGGSGGTSGSGGNTDGGLGGAGRADGPAADAPADGAPSGLAVVRTFVFHELTALNPGAALGAVISADGGTVAFVQNGYNPNHVFAMKFDGTGLTEVDSFNSNCACQARVDISGNGTGIVSSDSVTLRYVHADSAGKTTLLTLASGEISDFRITADGTKVFFIARRDTMTTGATPMALPRGVWVINPDGTGLKQVASAEVIAPMFNVTPDKIFPFSICGISLDVSNDGARVAFGVGVGGVGDEILGSGGDGTGVHKIADAGSAQQVHISGDGSKVAYVGMMPGAALTLNAIGFDGAGGKTIGDASATPFGDGCGKPSRLSGDGGQYFMSDVGLLFATDGSGALALAPNDFNGDWLVAGAIYGGSMSDDGTRFVFLNGDAGGQAQIISMQMGATPPPLGAAPEISGVDMTPTYLIVGGGRGVNLITAKVSAMGTLRLAIADFLKGGLRDPKVGYATMNDQAMSGDLAAGDGVFSTNQAAADSDAASGSRNMRVRAESTVGGKRHATVIEVTGLNVKFVL